MMVFHFKSYALRRKKQVHLFLFPLAHFLLLPLFLAAAAQRATSGMIIIRPSSAF